MGEILGCPVSVSKTSNGFGFYDQLCGQSIGRNGVCCPCSRYGSALRSYRRGAGGPRGVYMVSLPVDGCFWFDHVMRVSQMKLLLGSVRVGNSVYVPKMIASIESGVVCEDEEKETTHREEEAYGLDSLGGKLVIDPSMDFDPNLPSTSSNGKSIVNDIRVYFLEERDEEVLSRRILMLSRSNKVRSALELCKSMELTGLRPNVHSCNSLLSCLLRNGLVCDALRTFEFMKANEITTGHTYSLILKSVANSRGCDSALDLFAELQENSRQRKDFDVIVYNTVISICGKMNNWVETERLWRKMKENGHTGTQVTYSLLVSIFVRCDQNELALDAYDEMVQNGLKPREDTMHAMISACTKEGKLDLALKTFQSMLNGGLKPSQVACNTLINSLGKAGNVKLAFKIYDTMKSLHYTSDSFTWNALLGALYTANQHTDAIQLFERIREQSTLLNVHMYNTALMSCKKLGWWERALQLLWQMEASGLSVPAASYNLVIGTCEVARKPKIALQVYEHMVQQQCAPDIFTHLSLIRSCIWGSLWDEVEEIVNQVGPNVSLYNAAIQGMCLKGKVESAKKIYARMRENGLEPDGKTRALMLQNLGQNQNLQKRRN
ncbi:hypothetical protein SLE2022_191370 [Rubroshorea leprosula]